MFFSIHLPKPRKRSRSKPGVLKFEKYVAPPFRELHWHDDTYRRNFNRDIPSLTMGKLECVPVVKYSGAMLKREIVAQQEIERKKTMVAPLYNKGAYQFIGDAPPDIIKGLGRKS